MNRTALRRNEQPARERHTLRLVGNNEPAVEWTEYPRIKPGDYPAYCAWAKWYWDTSYNRWTCLLKFKVFSANHMDTLATVPMWLNGGTGERPRTGRRTLYFPAWVKANGGPPARKDRLSPSVFVRRMARVRVADTIRDAPMNVVWDVERRQSVRSPEIGYIEFVQRHYPLDAPEKMEACKKKDYECNRRNRVNHELYYLTVESIPKDIPDHFRYEFDFGIRGLEFSRAFYKHEKDDPKQWTAISAPSGEGCVEKAILSVVVSSDRNLSVQQSNIAENVKRALMLFDTDNYTEARPLLNQACNAGKAEACEDLGEIYHAGWGVDIDYFQAIALFIKACQAGNTDGCCALGNAYTNGEGVGQNYARAVELYTESCNKGNQIGCAYLGRMYQEGLGVERDYSRSVKLYTNACDGGGEYGYGCTALGVMYQDGYGVDKDSEKAKQFYRKGCSLGSQDGCDLLKNMP
jgi:hypothetical protein